jgi:polysaccharide export outer membrane protein
MNSKTISRSIIWISLHIVVLGFLSACAGTQSGVTSICPEPEGKSPDYVIGAGDTLEIFVWRNPELSGTVPVRPDGKLSISLVEDMVAVGKTPTKLARDIEAVLSEYLRLPKVNIIVVSEGASNQIQVVGNVVTPQSLSYREGIRMLDVIVAVGGLDVFAAGNRSQVIRNVEGRSFKCKVRLNDLLKEGDMEQNIAMYPGDVLIVPESRF